MPETLTDLIAEATNPPPRKLRLLFYDIETAPMLSFHWQPKAEWIPDQAVVSDDRFVLCWSAQWSDESTVLSARLSQKEARGQDDRRIVHKLAELMRQADYVIAHNGNRFDYKRVNARLLVNKLEPLGNVQMIDTLLIARQSFDLPYNNLNYLANKLGLGRKISTNLDLWKRAYYGEVSALKEMEEYNRQDVVLLEKVFWELVPYAKKLPRLVDMTSWRDTEHCPTCGSAKRSRVRKPHRTSVNNFSQYRCGKCRRTYRVYESVGSQRSGVVGT